MFKQVFRAILKYRFSSAMTICSLTIAFLGIVILSFYISFEKSFDRYHEDAENIYMFKDETFGFCAPSGIAKVVVNEFPEIEALSLTCTMTQPLSTESLAAQGVSFLSTITYCDDKFFDIFSVRIIAGQKSDLSNVVGNIMLTETLAKKLFKNENPIGKTILAEPHIWTVVGIIEDFPKNSILAKGDALVSLNTTENAIMEGILDNWQMWMFSGYVKLADNASAQAVSEKIMASETIIAKMEEAMGKKQNISLFPLVEHHLYEQGKFNYISIFILLIFVLLIMGSVNFINFSMSQAPLRSKSLAVMRVLGANKNSTKINFIAESIILSLIAMLFALILHAILSKSIESTFGISGIAMGERYGFLPLFLLGAAFIGAITALFPSIVITSIPVEMALKGAHRYKPKGFDVRNTLLCIQFMAAMTLTVSAIIMEKQLKYWQNYDMGFNREEIVYLEISKNHYLRGDAFAQELLSNKKIKDYTFTDALPGHVFCQWGTWIEDVQVVAKAWAGDSRFLNFMGIEVIDGNKFPETISENEALFLLNEKAISDYKLEAPIGKLINSMHAKNQIIGTVKDFNFNSLKDPVSPLIIWTTKDLTDSGMSQYFMMLKVSMDEDIQQTFDFIKKTALKFDPKRPTDVEFLDESINRLYADERKAARFVEAIALWCLLLGLIGLLGMVIFVCRNRVKEVGIRKVNGATVLEMILLINRDFIRVISISFIVAIPIAYFVMDKWLESFPYKTDLSWWIFMVAGLAIAFVSIATVCYQSYKAANQNPIKALRYE